MRVICKSGIEGWRSRLQENYSCYAEFKAFAETYGLHTRLGYKTIGGCWRANPMCEGSTDPADFRRVA